MKFQFACTLLLTGCTSVQAKEARRAIAGGLLEMVLDIATDGGLEGFEIPKKILDSVYDKIKSDAL